MPDIYTHNEIPQPLRVQITHIWARLLNDQYIEDTEANYKPIVDILHSEHGVYKLANASNIVDELWSFFLNETDFEKVLDVVEISFNIIENKGFLESLIDDTIEELNHRFKEHGVGYQYENRQIISVNSQLIHAEVVRPALQLLSDKDYTGAEQEFLKAHKHYREGNSEEALNECLKSFESVMKSICDKNNWDYDEGATSSNLINVCLENNLIPLYWQSHYSALRSLLESSVPTARNRLSGHGQGSDIRSVPDYLVAYMLHMTASAIVFLAEAGKNL